MKAILLSFVLIILVGINKTRAQEIIELPKYAKDCAVVFDSSYSVNFRLEFKERFTPRNDQLIEAERIIKMKYDSLKLGFSYNKLFKYTRQYLGFIDDLGDQYITVHFLKIRNKKMEKQYFQNWKEEMILGFGEFSENNLLILNVNLDKKLVTFP